MEQFEFKLQTPEDIIEISRQFPNGVILFCNKTNGGVMFTNGSLGILSGFAAQSMAHIKENVIWIDLFNRFVLAAELKHKNIIDAWKIEGNANNPFKRTFSDLPKFFTEQPDISKFDVLLCCCNLETGVMGANGDTMNIGAYIITMIELGQVDVLTWMKDSAKIATALRKQIN